MALSDLLVTEDFPVLIESGFIAVKQGNEQAAQRLFRAAQLLRPNHSAPVLGFGYIALHSMHLESARHLFESVLKKEPGNALAKVLLGFAYLASKFGSLAQGQGKQLTTSSNVKRQDIDALAKQGEKLIQEALKESNEPSVHSLGKSALELSKKISDYQATPLKS